MDAITNKLLRQAVPLFTVFAAIMLVLGIGALLILGKEVLIPLALAILLAFALAPVANWLQKNGLSRGLAVIGAVLMALTIIASVGYIVASQMTELAGDLPRYSTTMRDKIKSLSDSVSASGPFSRAGKVLTEVLGDIPAIGPQEPAGDKPTAVVVKKDSGMLAMIGDYLAPLVHPLATFAIVFLMTAFLLAQREDLRNRVIRLMGPDDIQQTTAALDDAGKRLARMLLTQLALNASFGLVIALGLWAIGLPSPFLWGILAGILRFVPYIGAIIGALAPLVIAFAVDPTWSMFMWTAGLFIVVEPIVGHVLEPMLYGKSSGLSPVAIVIAATLWAFLWGPIGLVLATPLTIILVVLGRHISRLEFLDVLLGDKPALKPHEVFYQRMLAGDPAEAVDQAKEVLQHRALATYYDDVALEAIRRAHLDIVRGTVANGRLKTLVDSARTLVNALAEPVRKRRRSWGHGVSAELEAALEEMPADRPSALRPIPPEELPESWRNSSVAVLYGTHPLDEAAALMLGQVLTRRGMTVRVVPMEQAQKAGDAETRDVALVCLSFVEPLSTLHLRAASIAVRRRAHAPIMLCIWQETEETILSDLSKKVRVDHIVTTTSDALDAVDDIIARLKQMRAAA